MSGPRRLFPADPEAIRVRVDATLPQPAGFRKVAVPVRLEIPLERVTLTPEDGGFVARLELRVAATDDGDNSAEIPVIPVEIRGRRPPQPGENGVFETSILLRKKPHRLLLALYDPLSDEMLSTRLDFEP